MITPRVQRLKDRFLSVRPNLTAERLLLETEAYKKFSGEPAHLFKAKTLEYILDNLAVTIHDEELIVGVPAKTLRGASIFPEFASTEWLLEEIPEFPTRPMDQIDVTDEDRDAILECLEDYWVGKAFEDLLPDILPEEIMGMFENAIIDLGQVNAPSSETVPDYEALLSRGLRDYINQCQELVDSAYAEGRASTCEDQKKIDFWRGLIIICEAVIRFNALNTWV